MLNLPHEEKMDILLITSFYPYIYGDASFIESEMPFLSKHFNKVHVLFTENNAVKYEKLGVPENIIVIPTASDTGKKNKRYRELKSLFILPFHLFRIIGILFKELWVLLIRKKIYVETIKTACNFLLDANLSAVFISKYLQQNPEINIVYTYWFERKTMASLLCKKYLNKNIKCITRTHGYDLYEFRLKNNYQPYKKWMDQHIDRIFFASLNGYNYYNNIFASSNKNKYIVSKLGIKNEYSLQDIYNKGDMNGCLKIISCSYMVPVKRIHLIIETLSRITDIKINWVHIGDGIERNNLESMAENLLKNNVNITYKFLGFFDNASVKKYYYNNCFDCFISTTETEGGNPVSMMEAISFGIPVIATNVGGVPEIVNNETGILLDPDNCVEELENALRRFASMAVSEKEALRKSCRKYWENNYRAETQYTQFVKHIIDLCNYQKE